MDFQSRVAQLRLDLSDRVTTEIDQLSGLDRKFLEVMGTPSAEVQQRLEEQQRQSSLKLVEFDRRVDSFEKCMEIPDGELALANSSHVELLQAELKIAADDSPIGEKVSRRTLTEAEYWELVFPTLHSNTLDMKSEFVHVADTSPPPEVHPDVLPASAFEDPAEFVYHFNEALQQGQVISDETLWKLIEGNALSWELRSKLNSKYSPDSGGRAGLLLGLCGFFDKPIEALRALKTETLNASHAELNEFFRAEVSMLARRRASGGPLLLDIEFVEVHFAPHLKGYGAHGSSHRELDPDATGGWGPGIRILEDGR